MKTSHQFKQLARTTSDHRLKLRYLAVHHFLSGKNRTQIAKYLGVARGSVNTWITKYLAGGINGLQLGKNSGRPRRLTSKQEKQVSVFILARIEDNTGGRLIAADIQQYISNQFDVVYELSAIYRLLHRLNFRWITSRSKHPKQSKQAQAVFKNLPTGNDPSHPV